MRDLLIGIDAGTSVIKSIAFDLAGQQVAAAAVANAYDTRPDGAATQPLARTWRDCAATLRALADKVPDLARRTAAVAVTGQGDGTWLIDRDGRPVGDGWLWLDARAAGIVRALRARPEDRARFEATGTGLSSCQQGTQLVYMRRHLPELLDGAATAMHCKDWLYFRLTGERATDPSEACFTFGNFRTRAYDEAVIASLGLEDLRPLLPPIIDGVHITHPLAAAAAAETGLLAGTPVALGYVDVVCTALGAGLVTEGPEAGCTIVGSTGIHMRATTPDGVRLNDDATGYVMVLPLPDVVAQVQSNMAGTINIDWILRLAAEVMSDMGCAVTHSELIDRADGWIAAAPPGGLIYQPYISEAGERGPFVHNDARAGFIGLNTGHRFAHLVRAVFEGLGMAARDCYAAMGPVPNEVRLTGGAARSRALRSILAASLGCPLRTSTREETGAAGAAMMAAVATGVYGSMPDCIADWVTPRLSEAEAPDEALAWCYAALYPPYRQAREAMLPVWEALARKEKAHNA
jgi:erythritol kinase